MTRALRAMAAALLLSTSTLAQLTPEKSAGTFQVSEGLEFTLWASEPLFVNPTCLDVDHKGRVWVCESVNYRNKLRGFKKLTRPEGDRIVILEDAKGDGKATRATTFYQSPDMMAPLGIAVVPYPDGKGVKVFVCQSPDILVFEDRDGDGKADGPPKKLLTGFRGIDHDHGVHSVLVGPDRKLYFTVGDSGVAGLQSSDGNGRKWTSNSTDCRAGTVWRCELDGTKLELLAHNFRNNYEVAVDSFGTMLLSDNDDDGNQQTRICHVIPGGNYGYHPRGKGESHWHEEQPGVMPKILRTYFGSPTGMCIYEGKLLPKKYHGMPLHTDAGPRHVRAYHLKPKGASYEVDREDIVFGKDSDFRPSDVCVGPDGSVYVADWHDPVVGGHAMRDIKTGRIYRLAPKGSKVANPKIDVSTGKGTMEALASPNLAARAMAMARLAEMRSDEYRPLLLAAFSQKDDPVLRARAGWVFARIGRGFERETEALLKGFAEDADPRFQVLAIRLAKEFLIENALLLAAFIEKVASASASAAVHREALIALHDIPPAMSKERIYALMKKYDGKDRHYLASVGIAVGHHEKGRRDLILADFDKQFPEWNEKVAGLAWELRPPGMVGMLKKRLLDRGLTAKDRFEAARALFASDGQEAGLALLEAAASDGLPEAREELVTNLAMRIRGKWKDLARSKELAQAIANMLDRPESRRHALILAGAARREELTDRSAELARDPRMPQDVRLEALSTLGQIGTRGALSTLADLAKKLHPPLSHAAAFGLGSIGQEDGPIAKEAITALEGMLEGVGGLDRAAGIALAGSRAGSLRLLDLHADKKLPARVIEAVAGPLRNSAYVDIQKRARAAFPAPGKMDPKKLPGIKELALRKGSAERGRKLFEASIKSDLACARCHTVEGSGGQVGPDLSMIGKKLGREGMLESILMPSKGVADQYVTWIVQTTKGLTVQGLLVEDGPAGVVLRDAEGRDTRIAPADIEKREKSPKSIMPEDLVAHMTLDELIDLVEHLLTLRKASYTPASWHVAGPFEGKVDSTHGPDREVDLKATYDGKGGKVTWRTVRPGTSGYVDLAALHGARGQDSVSYLVADFESPEEQDAELVLGSDDGCKVFLNGKLAHTSRETRAAAPDQARAPVRLRKGANRVLFKIDNGNNPHGLFFRVVSEQELKPRK